MDARPDRMRPPKIRPPEDPLTAEGQTPPPHWPRVSSVAARTAANARRYFIALLRGVSTHCRISSRQQHYSPNTARTRSTSTPIMCSVTRTLERSKIPARYGDTLPRKVVSALRQPENRSIKVCQNV
jgi:hypothetical protein